MNKFIKNKNLYRSYGDNKLKFTDIYDLGLIESSNEEFEDIRKIGISDILLYQSSEPVIWSDDEGRVEIDDTNNKIQLDIGGKLDEPFKSDRSLVKVIPKEPSDKIYSIPTGFLAANSNVFGSGEIRNIYEKLKDYFKYSIDLDNKDSTNSITLENILNFEKVYYEMNNKSLLNISNAPVITSTESLSTATVIVINNVDTTPYRFAVLGKSDTENKLRVIDVIRSDNYNPDYEDNGYCYFGKHIYDSAGKRIIYCIGFAVQEPEEINNNLYIIDLLDNGSSCEIELHTNNSWIKIGSKEETV